MLLFSSSLFLLLLAAINNITAQSVATNSNVTSSNTSTISPSLINILKLNTTDSSSNTTNPIVLSNVTSIDLNNNNNNNNAQINNNNINNSTNNANSTTINNSNLTFINNSNGNISDSENFSPFGNDLTKAIEAASKVEPNESPKSDKAQILAMYEKYFFKPRAHEDPTYKAYVREGMIKRLQDLGYKTAFLQRSDFEYKRKPASSYNIIGILPGRHRYTKDDKILLVGAHWDSYNLAPGVDDNASGSISIIEIARLLAEAKCSFEHTIMFVWFDYEEQGKFGSEFFVNDYLFPKELDLHKSQFIGAYIMDMILVRDRENNTQTLSASLKIRLQEFSDELEKEKNRGDFLATWSRRKHDEPLENAFKESWQSLGNEARTFKAMRPDLPQDRIPNAEERYHWKDFFRSDHASFWYPTLKSNAVSRAPVEQLRPAIRPSLNAILLTDLGPWRKSYARCYHSACDDKHLLTDGNLAFMQQVTDSLVLTLLRVGHGQCSIKGTR